MPASTCSQMIKLGTLKCDSPRSDDERDHDREHDSGTDSAFDGGQWVHTDLPVANALLVVLALAVSNVCSESCQPGLAPARRPEKNR